jgi:pimeloyl-ACP methyl ester carboxylesterase
MIGHADKRRIAIDGLSIAFHDIGSGDPIVFLHGNPTSSFSVAEYHFACSEGRSLYCARSDRHGRFRKAA